MLVRELERALLAAFPRQNAESWDHVGLSVGEPDAEVAGVAIALDATVRSIEETLAAGANVLVTHHPVYLKAPDAFMPPDPERPSSSAVIYAAARQGVSVISLHTNLDRSREARELLCALIGGTSAGSLEHPDDADAPGLGAICELPDTVTLGELAANCADRFGGAPRVWGAPETPVRRIGILGGSLGSFGEDAIALGAQAIVCGEAGYHVCQDLAARGWPPILLGHDRSEEPFGAILMNAVIHAGVDAAHVCRITHPDQWWTVSTVNEQERS